MFQQPYSSGTGHQAWLKVTPHQAINICQPTFERQASCGFSTRFATWKCKWKHLRVGSCISHSWNKTANKKGVIMMLHHLTQLQGLGCLPACYNRDREIPPVNNGPCTLWAFKSELWKCAVSVSPLSFLSPLCCLPCCCGMWNVFPLPLFCEFYITVVTPPPQHCLLNMDHKLMTHGVSSFGLFASNSFVTWTTILFFQEHPDQ